jgi:hypothetical protein
MAQYGQDTTEDEFSYERDVEPMVGSYFKSLQSSGIDFNTQVRMVESERKRLETNLFNEAAVRANAQKVEITRLQLENARREAAGSRSNIQGASALARQLDYVMTQVPEEEQPVVISRLGLANAALIESNPIAKFAFSTAEKGISSSRKSQAQTDRVVLTKGIMDSLGSVKLARDDYSKKPIDAFEDEGSEDKVNTIISTFGSQEQQKEAEGSTAMGKLGIARKIRNGYTKSILTNGAQQQQTQSPRSLYKKPSGSLITP